MEEINKRLRRIWYGMKRRCSPNQTGKEISFYYYDKGIRVCDEWQNDFFAFQEWALQNGYEDHLTIDRIDSYGNYEPSNCQWLTRSENSRKAILERKKPLAERRYNNGLFMVIEKVEMRCGHCEFYMYKVIQTGLRKSDARKIAEKLNSELLPWKHKYMARVTLDCKEGQLVSWSQTGQYLNSKKQQIT